MTTYFTFWHWSALITLGIIFLLLVLLSLKEKNQKNILSMIFASFLVISTASVFVVMAIDKYTKKAILYGVENTRILRNETIVYTGYVKNKGDYQIGKITLTVKLVNRGHVTGNVKAGSFYKPSGFFDFLTSIGDDSKNHKPQKVEVDFVVAENIEPGKAKFFRVEMPYPPYFKHVADFTSISAH
jgi:hypothetical protein